MVRFQGGVLGQINKRNDIVEAYLNDRIQMWEGRLKAYDNALRFEETLDWWNMRYYKEQISILKIIVAELMLVQQVLQGEPNASDL